MSQLDTTRCGQIGLRNGRYLRFDDIEVLQYSSCSVLSHLVPIIHGEVGPNLEYESVIWVLTIQTKPLAHLFFISWLGITRSSIISHSCMTGAYMTDVSVLYV